MLEKLIFNQELYRYRLENENELLLYNVGNGEIYLTKGKTKDFLIDTINNQISNIGIENKYIEFLKNSKILEES